jgi:hypothetical protein
MPSVSQGSKLYLPFWKMGLQILVIGWQAALLQVDGFIQGYWGSRNGFRGLALDQFTGVGFAQRLNLSTTGTCWWLGDPFAP